MQRLSLKAFGKLEKSLVHTFFAQKSWKFWGTPKSLENVHEEPKTTFLMSAMNLFRESKPSLGSQIYVTNVQRFFLFGIHCHQGEFSIGSYFKVKDSTKSSVRFLVLVRQIFFYHLKAYLHSFILSRGFNFLDSTFMA